MTDIPGTGHLSDKKSQPSVKPQSSTISVVNVGEIKKQDWQKERPEDKLWYNLPKYWVLIGCSASVVFLLLSLINWTFLVLIPLGPIIGYVSWRLRRIGKKFDSFDPLSK